MKQHRKISKKKYKSFKDFGLNSEIESLKPIFEGGNKYICASYFHDRSGSLSITDREGNEIYEREDARLEHHIVGLKQELKKIDKNKKIIEQSINFLEKIRDEKFIKK
jgi:hypothetical protein